MENDPISVEVGERCAINNGSVSIYEMFHNNYQNMMIYQKHVPISDQIPCFPLLSIQIDIVKRTSLYMLVYIFSEWSMEDINTYRCVFMFVRARGKKTRSNW